METKVCKNCSKNFNIEPDDFGFYEKMGVPAPIFCPDCRLQRRLAWCNQRKLYKRTCSFSGKNIISTYDADAPFPVYALDVWWSDVWDPLSFGMEVDFSRPFFDQLNELENKVPHRNLEGAYQTWQRTEYANMAHALKDCYLIYNSDYDESCMYGSEIENSQDCVDCQMLEACELCYECINCTKCNRTYFSEDCEECHGVYFSKDCIGCTDCFGCIGLRKKSYCIWNEQYSKSEYEKKIKEMGISDRDSINKMKNEVQEFFLKNGKYKFMHGRMNMLSTGDYIYGCKNVKDSFIVRESESCRHCMWLILGNNKDCYDFTQFGESSERVYDSMCCGLNIQDVYFSTFVTSGSANVYYSQLCTGSSNLFGCIGIKSGKYCILNKEYTKEEYEVLVLKIIEHMKKTGEWGEFPAINFSPYAYNETSAMDYFPLTKEESLAKGYRWNDKSGNVYTSTMNGADLPKSIDGTDESVCKEVIKCEKTGKSFKITAQEFNLYRKLKVPVPSMHPDARHEARLQKRNSPKFYQRSCMCTNIGHLHERDCTNEFETAYAPTRPEIIYCESCYQQEVA